MGTDKKVQILLSTYNGEKYLEDQLKSYAVLEGGFSYHVFIRDDGSTDGTIDILLRYAKKSNFMVEFGDHRGLNASYCWLIEHCRKDYDYYALSDQDDIWLPNKMALAVESLCSLGGGIPGLFFSRSILIDADAKPIGKTPKVVREPSFYNAVLQNVCPGHTQVFNRELLKWLRRYSDCRNIYAFDWFVYLIATIFGIVLYSEECTVLHRQHGSNTVGFRHGWLPILLRRFGNVFVGRGKFVSRQIEGILRCAGKDMPKAYRKEVELFLNSQDTFASRLCYVLHSKVYRQSKVDTTFFRCIYFFGGYNPGAVNQSSLN